MTARDYILKKRYRDELRRVVMKLMANPAASESVSTPNGGSRSVSYTSLASLQAELRTVEEEIAQFANSIGSPTGIGVNYARWC